MSKKTEKENRKIAAIKKAMEDKCFICGKSRCDAAHILPRSLYPEYRAEPWNIIPLCRYHHMQYDDCREFRRKCKDIIQKFCLESPIGSDLKKQIINRHFL